MEIRDEHGLAVALVDTTELADRPWLSAAAAIDVVRTIEPPEHAWAELETLGFIRKPDFVCWRGGGERASSPQSRTSCAGGRSWGPARRSTLRAWRRSRATTSAARATGPRRGCA